MLPCQSRWSSVMLSTVAASGSKPLASSSWKLEREPLSPVSRKVDALLASPESAGLSLGKLSGLAGYQHDYLNRLLKNHAGLTLGQFRSRKRVARAQQLLRQPKTVAEISGLVGFTEPNYFARWFRKQTGMTPTEWRRQNLGTG